MGRGQGGGGGRGGGVKLADGESVRERKLKVGKKRLMERQTRTRMAGENEGNETRVTSRDVNERRGISAAFQVNDP